MASKGVPGDEAKANASDAKGLDLKSERAADDPSNAPIRLLTDFLKAVSLGHATMRAQLVPCSGVENDWRPCVCLLCGCAFSPTSLVRSIVGLVNRLGGVRHT